MSFLIENVQLEDFRNYGLFELASTGRINILIGDNATGKTNLMEAIQLLSSGYSFRRPLTREIIRSGSSRAKIAMLVEDKQANRKNDIQIIFDDEGKKFIINGNKKNAQDISSVINHVLFVPDDLRIIKGSAERRREAIDGVGIQLSPTYASLKKDYEKVVKQRNILLKDEFVPHYLIDSWTESLIEIGTLFYIHRRKLFERMKEIYFKIYSLLAEAERIDIEYIPSWKNYLIDDKEEIKKLFKELLEEMALEERRRKISLLGPHKDEIEFKINGSDARRFGSQGQQRTLVLAWKLTEVEVIKEVSDNTPILLLDDVMSELDANRRESLIQFIESRQIQTFITTTHLDYFSPMLLNNATIVEL